VVGSGEASIVENQTCLDTLIVVYFCFMQHKCATLGVAGCVVAFARANAPVLDFSFIGILSKLALGL